LTRALVTGGRGFVGRQIVAALAAHGFEVAATTSSKPDPLITGARWFTVDLMDPAATRQVLRDWQPEILVHAAWDTTHGSFWTSEANYDWVSASLNLIRSFTAEGGRRFVGVGSCAEYDWNAGTCFEASTPLQPWHCYGDCKATVFRLSSRFAADRGISFAWARIFLVYGPHEGEARLVPSVVRGLLRGETVKVSLGTQIRDVMHVADAGEAIATLAAGDVVGPVNIGTGEQVSLADVVGLIGTLTGHSDLIAYGALPLRPDDPPVLVPHVTRLRHEVGYRPRHSLQTGLADAIAWWQQKQHDNAQIGD
jgi:nucleoside-diphosphate-sugar epimerase